MQAHSAFTQLRNLPIKDFEAEFGKGRILVLAPHPDDESLGCGGMIAEACRRGQPPVIAILTDGAQSHPNSRAYPAERLRRLREAEAEVAVCTLGVPNGNLVFLRYPDGAAPHEGNPLAEAAQRVADLSEHWAIETMVVSWRHDPHCDHEAASLIAEAACRLTGTRLLAYPVWGWTLPPDTDIDIAPITGFRLDVSHHLPGKRAAIEAHRSQYAGLITDDPEGFQMPADFIDRFMGADETYISVDVQR